MYCIYLYSIGLCVSGIISLSVESPCIQLDSLKYLSQCTLKYGTDRMAKHAGAIWFSLKDAIYTSYQPNLNFALESLDNFGFQESGILAEALTLLQTVIKQNTSLFINYIVGDEDIKRTFNAISGYKIYSEIPSESKQNLHTVSCILSVSAKASVASCNIILENFLPHLITTLGISIKNSPQDQSTRENNAVTGRLNHGALYLCIELLAACRDLTTGSEVSLAEYASANGTWYCLFQSFSASLNEVFASVLATNTHDTTYDLDMYFGGESLSPAVICSLVKLLTLISLLLCLSALPMAWFSFP